MTKADKQWLNDICRLGCVVCSNLGNIGSPAEVHHLRSGVGAAQKSTDQRSIPLCPMHHRLGGYGVAFHAGQRVWQEKFGNEEDLLAQTVIVVEHYRKFVMV